MFFGFPDFSSVFRESSVLVLRLSESERL
jgi:hypothetical protein